MRHSLATAAALALAATMIFAPTPATAAPVVVKAATVKADDPFSVFAVTVKGPKTVKAGGKIVYRIKVENQGPYLADYYWLGGQLPKGIATTVYWDGVKGTKCAFEGGGFWCAGPDVLREGETDWLTIEVKLKKGTKGTAVANLGVESWDVQRGMENLSREELDRIGGVPRWWFGKTVKTKIAR